MSLTEQLGDALYDALRSRRTVAPLSDTHELTVEDAYRISLRFLARREQDGEKATRQLVSDVFRAAARGLARALPTRPLREVDGVVKLLVAGRALVSIGNAMAAVAQELTVEDVPIERLMTVGQRVSGRYDADTNRLDVTTSLRPADDALTGYVLGDVVLARVVSVRADKGRAHYRVTVNNCTGRIIDVDRLRR